MEYIQCFFYLSLSFYSIVLLLLYSSLSNLKTSKKYIEKKISVIIAIKNGETSLNHLLKCLTNQNYKGNIEFILVDDQSTDNTSNIITDYIKKDSRIILTSSVYGNKILLHKKKAIDAGIKISNGEILLFTDVDCDLPNDWVSNLLSNFSNKVDYVVGYSEVPFSTNLVTLFQKFDFFMLMNAAHSSINRKWFWASSGQNQAYKKSLFVKNNGFNDIAKFLQGDDTLFLQMSNKKTKKFNANFCYKSESKVYCRQEKKLKSFLLQRIRWSGDAIKTWRYNKKFFLMSIFTFFSNFILIINLLFYLFNTINFYQFTIPLFIKFFIEYAFAHKGMRVHDDHYSIFQFTFWFIFQPFYIISIGMGSFFQNTLNWRGKKLN